MNNQKRLEYLTRVIGWSTILNLILSSVFTLAVNDYIFSGNELLSFLGGIAIFLITFRIINAIIILMIKVYMYKNDVSSFEKDLGILLKFNAEGARKPEKEPTPPKENTALVSKEFVIGAASNKVVGRFKDTDIHEWIDLIDPETQSRKRYYFEGIHDGDDFSTIENSCVIIQPGLIFKSEQ